MSSLEHKSGAAKGDDSDAAGCRIRVTEIRAALRKLKEEDEAAGLTKDGLPPVVAALREEYKTHLDLYKHYLTVAASFNVFYYGVTGAVLSYALSGERWRAFALTFTVLMSYFFARVFKEAKEVFGEAENDVRNIACSLGVKRNEVRILTRILKFSYDMYRFNCFALSVLLVLKLFGYIPEVLPAPAPK